MNHAIAALVLIVVGAAVWWHRRIVARRRLMEIDAGKRCVFCNCTDVELSGGKVRCRRCGLVARLSALRGIVLSEGEISDLTRPKDDDF